MMNPYIVGFLVGLATFFICIYFCLFHQFKDSKYLNRYLLLISGVSILVALSLAVISPFFFTSTGLFKGEDFKEFAALGDTLGGLTNPFIGVAAVIVTGLAFYAQFQANKQIQYQFKLQQFESQLFKIIDNYNYTINNFKMKSRESNEIFEGKDYFFSLHQEYKSAYSDIVAFSEMYFDKHNHKKSYRSIIHDDYLNTINNITNDIDKIIQLEISYIVVFFGVSNGGRDSIIKLFEHKYDSEYILQLTNCLSYKLQGFQKNDDGKSYWADKKFQLQLTDWTKPNESNKVKYHNGHQSKLGHYYRQNYMIIKFIDDFKDEKLDYNPLCIMI